MPSLPYRQCGGISCSSARVQMQLSAHGAGLTGELQPICIQELDLQCAHVHQVPHLLQPSLTYRWNPALQLSPWRFPET